MRHVLGLAALVVVVALIVVLAGSAVTGPGGSSSSKAHRRGPATIPAAESGLLPWRLSAPLSREVVLPGSGRQLVILGGLTGSTSGPGVFSLNGATGRLRRLGSLKVGVHDAAGGLLDSRDFVFGGGSPTTVSSVESFAAPTHPGRLGPFPGLSSGARPLPAPRSDAASATVGRTTYIVGGYDGANPDASVLGTSDGRTYSSVATLPVPVRYPAVAALSGKIYVFGGEAITGPGAGGPTGDIQVVDPSRKSAAVVGHLPEPLQGAAAITLGGDIYLAGGDSSTPPSSARGVGTTQLSSPVSPEVSAHLFTVPTIWAFDPAHHRLLPAGRLQVPVSHAGVTTLGSRGWLVGGESGGTQLSTVQMIMPNRSFGTAGAPGAGSPYSGGRLLVADRANNRLLLLDPSMHIDWRFPSASVGRDRLGFYFPDDAFFVRHGAAIVSNQEQNETVQEIAYPSGKVVWSYGHPRRPGSGRGYLHEPDDAYLLKNGDFTVADAQNCRVLIIRPDHSIRHQIGTSGACAHHPPRSLDSPNGDTPLADGNLLVSEITDHRVTEYTPTGHPVWGVSLPISYPSDPQQLGPDRYLVADYADPGQILEFNRAGKILYRYSVSSGPGMLNHPSLVERLPSGVFVVNDDYRDRMVAIDPATRALVWQYGITDQAGTRPGMLRIPDGFDLLMANGTTPMHPTTG